MRLEFRSGSGGQLLIELGEQSLEEAGLLFIQVARRLLLQQPEHFDGVPRESAVHLGASVRVDR